MSACCSDYPLCNCEGNRFTIEESRAIEFDLKNITTTDYRQPNLNFGISKRGTRKIRNKKTNLTPPKKKRK